MEKHSPQMKEKQNKATKIIVSDIWSLNETLAKAWQHTNDETYCVSKGREPHCRPVSLWCCPALNQRWADFTLERSFFFCHSCGVHQSSGVTSKRVVKVMEVVSEWHPRGAERVAKYVGANHNNLLCPKSPALGYLLLIQLRIHIWLKSRLRIPPSRLKNRLSWPRDTRGDDFCFYGFQPWDF